MQKKNCRLGFKAKGLTLVELLVTMSILIIIILILYAAFNTALRGWRKSDNMLQAAEIARVVLERMSREISSAMVKEPKNQFYCLGFDSAAPSGFRTNSIGDEFYFIGPLKSGNDDGSDLCEAGYWLNGQGTAAAGDDTLMRFYVTDDRKVDPTPEFDFNYSTGNNNELATRITGLEFEFFAEDGTLSTTWDSRSDAVPPAKISITITITVGKGTKATNPDIFVGDFSTFVSLFQ